MIEFIQVVDFQGHKRVKVKLDPLVTTLVGPNDAGKSSLLRAIMLACFNSHRQPDRFIRTGKDQFRIRLGVDGHVVERRKGKGVNLYLLDGKVYHFDSTRQRVPDKIAALLNMSRDNFALQQDQHFFFSETGGQVSRRLNEIVNLGLVDTALAKAASKVKATKAEVEFLRDSVREAKSELVRLEWVPEFAARVDELDTLREEAANASNSLAEAQSILREGSDAMKGLKSLGGAFKAGIRVVQLGKLAEKAQVRATEAKTMLAELTRAERDANIVVPDIGPLLAIRKKADRVAEDRREAEHLLADIKLYEDEICDLDEQLKVAEKEVRLARKRGKKCPTCGTRLRSSQAIGTCPKKHR